MRNNYGARKTRQLKYRLKLLKSYSATPNCQNARFQKLILEIKHLIAELRYFISKTKMQKIVGGAALLLGISLGPTAEAQQFGKRVVNPFGITQMTVVTIPALGDLDGDGDLDLLSSNYNGDFEYAENIGSAENPYFGESILAPFGLTHSTSFNFITLCDLDNDGDLDVLSSSYEGVLFYENVGDEASPLFGAQPVVNPFGTELPALGDVFLPELVDWDNDGDLDLILGGYATMLYYENIGTAENPAFGNFQLNPFNLSFSTEEYVIPEVADIDQDGDFDIIAIQEYGNFVFYENIGTSETPAFTNGVTSPFGLAQIQEETVSFLEIADMDNDGDEDILISVYAFSFGYYENIEPISPTENIISNNTITLSPNPTTSILNIQSDWAIETVEIFDLVGRRVLVQNYSGQAINLNHLESGMYIAKFKSEQEEVVIKRFEKI